jgi:SH3-like domain-containing protein
MSQTIFTLTLALSSILFLTPAHAVDPANAQSGAASETADQTTSGPIAPSRRFYRVAGDDTPSSFPVPRFVSLKFNRVNARTGPSRNHSVAYQYQRRGLPLIVVAETEMWRKVRDMQGDEAWVRKPALSGERFAVLSTDALLYAKPDRSARTLARIETGALVRLDDCEDAGFCHIRTTNGIKGFTLRQSLWGAQTLD